MKYRNIICTLRGNAEYMSSIFLLMMLSKRSQADGNIRTPSELMLNRSSSLMLVYSYDGSCVELYSSMFTGRNVVVPVSWITNQNQRGVYNWVIKSAYFQQMAPRLFHVDATFPFTHSIKPKSPIFGTLIWTFSLTSSNSSACGRQPSKYATLVACVVIKVRILCDNEGLSGSSAHSYTLECHQFFSVFRLLRQPGKKPEDKTSPKWANIIVMTESVFIICFCSIVCARDMFIKWFFPQIYAERRERDGAQALNNMQMETFHIIPAFVNDGIWCLPWIYYFIRLYITSFTPSFIVYYVSSGDVAIKFNGWCTAISPPLIDFFSVLIFSVSVHYSPILHRSQSVYYTIM